MLKKIAAVALLLSFTSLMSFWAVAQESKKKADAPEPLVISKQLPKGYSRLGLTDTQRKAIYKVRATYAVKREALQKELESLRLKETEDTEALLTEAQRSRLKELRLPAEKK